jgi:hypothetical protein
MGILTALGCLIFFIGWIWLVITGFKVGGVLWGIINIFFQPLTGLIFCIVKKAGWQPFIVMLIGLVLFGGFGGMTMISNYPAFR